MTKNDLNLYAPTLSLAIIELENYNLYLGDFDSLLEKPIQDLDEIFNRKNISSIPKQLIKSFFNRFNLYKRVLKNMKINSDKYAEKLKPYLHMYHENKVNYFNALKEFKEKIKKYSAIVDAQLTKCIEYMNEYEDDVFDKKDAGIIVSYDADKKFGL